MRKKSILLALDKLVSSPTFPPYAFAPVITKTIYQKISLFHI